MHSKNGRSAKSQITLASLGVLALAALVLSGCTTGTPANTWVKPNQNLKTKAGFGNEAPSPYISGKNVFVQTPAGGIKALDLNTGDPAIGATLAANEIFRPTWLSRLKAGALRSIKSPVSPILTTGDDDAEIVIGAGGSKVAAVAIPSSDDSEDDSDDDAGWTSTIKAVGDTTPKVISNMAVAHDSVYVPVANLPKDLAELDGEQLTNKLEGKSSNNGQIVSLNTSNGDVNWTKKLASVPLGAATVVNNIVFTSTLDGHVYGFETGSGDTVFESKLPAGAVAPIAAFDGTLIVPAGWAHTRGQKAQVVAFTIGGLGEVGGVAAPKVKKQTEAETAESADSLKTEGGEEAAGGAADGAALFTQNCAGCHTLKAANATGTVGPNLDTLGADEATVQKQVENGGGGMPAFKGTLSPEEITALAKYVSSVAGG
jgi:mono/diheme cytochrome c family protein